MTARAAAAVALAILAAAETPALANGRVPATTSVRFAPTDAPLVVLPSTFGLLISSDGGDSFRWVCESAIGYGGTYDPDYAVAADGRIYATVFDGLRASDDGGCTFAPIGPPLASPAFVSEVEIGPDGRVWAATATGSQPNDVYVSSDGETFTSVGLADDQTWWRSIRIAPGDPDRIYVSGLRLGSGGTASSARLAESENGGQTWNERSVADFAFAIQPDLFVEGVSPADPQLVFARVRGASAAFGDDLYRSTDGGVSWSMVASWPAFLSAFVIRADGDVIAGSPNPCEDDPVEAQNGCVLISTDDGATFDRAAENPRMGCISERPDGVLFACGANGPPDEFALGRSDDGASWTGVLTFDELAPRDCPTGTEQDTCEVTAWSMTCEQIGQCSAGPGDAGIAGDPPSGGCCSASGRPGRALAGAFVLALCAWLPLTARRRRRTARGSPRARTRPRTSGRPTPR